MPKDKTPKVAPKTPKTSKGARTTQQNNDKIFNPVTRRFITKHGKSYKKLLEDGYTKEDLEKYTKDTSFILKPKNVKTTDTVNVSVFKVISPTLFKTLNTNDIFALYISNKDIAAIIDKEYLDKHKVTFLPWLKRELKKQADLRKQKEEKERKEEEFKRRLLEQFKPPLSAELPYKPSRQMLYGYQSAVLQRLNLQSKSDYRKWLMKNHPDKGGNAELAKVVIAEAQRMGW
jgi:hypothetical protein